MASPSPRHLLKQAIAAARQGDRSRARMFLAKATELDPEEPLGWLWRAGLAEEAEQALIWLNRALELDPSQPNARRALPKVRMQAAQAVAWAGDFSTARGLFEQAADADPDSIAPWIHLAGMGRTPDETISCLQEVLRRQPDHAGAQMAIEHMKRERLLYIGTPTPLSLEIRPPEPPPTLEELESDDAIVERLGTTPVPQPPSHDSGNDSSLANYGDYSSTNYGLIPERFTLPADHADASFIESGHSEPVSMSRFPVQRHASVMIIDDNADVRDFVHRHLEPYGLDVIAAEGADDAIAILRENGVPNLILIDGVMPKVDGYELCNLLRQNTDTATVPIVLLARKDGWLPRIKSMMTGFNDTLAKPISPGSLRAVVSKFCPMKNDADNKSWPEIPEEVLR